MVTFRKVMQNVARRKWFFVAPKFAQVMASLSTPTTPNSREFTQDIYSASWGGALRSQMVLLLPTNTCIVRNDENQRLSEILSAKQ